MTTGGPQILVWHWSGLEWSGIFLHGVWSGVGLAWSWSGLVWNSKISFGLEWSSIKLVWSWSDMILVWNGLA